ncbi:DUF605-domain-containing protein [Mollisia scopiformis]|uniref:DUF605-domain-containing protein n=1 Tax=Mollisia scopiformis TaxID=149040 RepID=A0A194XWR6_MOLSC|nr:DUF605-domain-containing protein [Mollisia scopiformis]KUJ24688.1 DUF605-domain-containing protein [Mollisia scopiformis]
MAANIPAKLKAADLTRFIVRASQLEAVKPVVAYWCEYWIVNQILAKGLHNGDPETLQYTTTLMDKLELIKAENATNDAIVDDAAGQAYVEHFGLETFFRADRAVKANVVTKQTADTFQAAATFLELVNIWGTPDAETQSKIKYAKWNAVRIVRAIREGKDPNESNPKPDPVQEEVLPELDPNDPEVQQLEGPSKPQPASVEDVPDEQDKVEARIARQSSIDQSLHPSAEVSARGSPGNFEPYPRDGFPYTAVQDDNVSPLEPSPNERTGSVGGGYFPEVPTFTSQNQEPTLPTAPPDVLNLPQQPSAPPGFRAPEDFESFPPPTLPDDPPMPPQDFYRQSPPAQQPHVPPPQVTAYTPPVQQSPYQPPHQQPPPQFQPPPQQYQPPPQQYQPPPQRHIPAPAPAQAPAPIRKDQLITDDMSIAKAQKHARWAISALNFEDAETAVKELRAALQTLGAS